MAISLINNVLIFLLFLSLSIASSFLVLRILHKANFKQENFLKKEIITSSGLVFLIFLVLYGVYLFFAKDMVALKGWPFSLLLIGFGMGVLGFLDDLFGDNEVSGFAGHFGALAKGKVTTGLVKAVLGFGLSFLVAFLASSGIVNIIVNTLIVALAINLFNLLDLRPGRSLKAFLISGTLIFSFSRISGLWLVSLPVLAPVFVLLYLDLQLMAMLGDAGSNILGGLVGVWIIYSFGLKVNLAVLLGLIIIHLYSEKHSISQFISKNKILSWFDNLGLKKH